MQRPGPQPGVPCDEPPINPIILVEDRTQKPIITAKYMYLKNEIDFQTVYVKVKKLVKHPRCSHRNSGDAWPCPPCEKTFLEAFWSSAANLLDYFADFLHVDTPIMQGLWFRLLDIWQETKAYFPTQQALAQLFTTNAATPAEIEAAKKATKFEIHFNESVALVNELSHGMKGERALKENIVHTPSGDYNIPEGYHNTGPYLSGLKPWEQWLSSGGPGVDIHASSSKMPRKVQYVPMPAIAIMKTHTERTERLAAKVNPDPEFLADVKRHSLVFPTSSSAERPAYKSRSGAIIQYELINGAPPVMRSRGFGDPELSSSTPGFSELDDTAGRVRGAKAYEPVSGNIDMAEDFEPFDVWAVYSSNEVEPEISRDKLFNKWVERDA